MKSSFSASSGVGRGLIRRQLTVEVPAGTFSEARRRNFTLRTSNSYTTSELSQCLGRSQSYLRALCLRHGLGRKSCRKGPYVVTLEDVLRLCEITNWDKRVVIGRLLAFELGWGEEFSSSVDVEGSSS